jgi:hypothetical protein
MRSLFIILALFILIFGCISQPIRPAAPSVPSHYAQDIGSSASAVSQTQSKNYWAASSPFAITAWKYSGTSLTLYPKNMDGAAITITQVYADGALVYSGSTTINPGESGVITATTASSCGSSGSNFEVDDIRITYTKSSASGLEQKGAKPIVGTCG